MTVVEFKFVLVSIGGSFMNSVIIIYFYSFEISFANLFYIRLMTPKTYFASFTV